MKKYKVLVEEILSKEIVVMATDEMQADEIVQKAYDNQQIILTADDFHGDLTLGGEYTVIASDDDKITNLLE